MYLLVLVLNKEELWKGSGEPGPGQHRERRSWTLPDGTDTGAGRSRQVLAGFRIFKHSRPRNKTIISVIDSVEKEKAIHKIKETIGDFDKPGVGIMFTLPLVDVIGVNGISTNLDAN